MSFSPPVLNPSQTVDRIREIIVGRQLDHLEGRIAHLEKVAKSAGDGRSGDVSIFEGRMLEAEAKLEALHESVGKMRGYGGTVEEPREEVKQMAQRIHEIAKARAEETVLPAVEGLERKLGQWLSDWQISLRQRLEERDRAFEEKLGRDLAGLRGVIEGRFEEVESRMTRGVESRFERIAEAARMLADCASEVVEANRSKI